MVANSALVREFRFRGCDEPPISDEDFAERSQLEEALIASFNLEASRKRREPDESLQGRLCSICFGNKPPSDFFEPSGCTHSFCVGCMSDHVNSEIQKNISTVKCPGYRCEGTVNPNDCRLHPRVPKQFVDKWETIQIESMILKSPDSLYCPFGDCSALLEGKEAVTGAVECPHCHRLFCVTCNVAWHSGLNCDEFKRNDIDTLTKKFFDEKEWKRCPNCNFYVEKTGGCLHIVCRCRYEFCYGCRSEWKKCRSGCRRR